MGNDVIFFFVTVNFVWLGLTDKDSEDHFISQHTNKTANFLYWAINEPTGTVKEGHGHHEHTIHNDCVEIVYGNDYGHWADEECSDRKRVICEME